MSAPVVIVGGGVAGLAAAWSLLRAGREVIVLERSARAGGLVETERAGGLVLEHGPDAILESKQGGIELVRALGLEPDLVRGGPAPRRAFVERGDRLVPLPEGLAGMMPRSPWSLATSPLLGLAGRARLFLEPLIAEPRHDPADPRGEPSGDETVASFVERRMGVEARARLVDPMLRAIYGAASDRLGMDATLPHLRALVRTHGSVGRALLRPRAAPAGGLATLRSGMDAIVVGLARELGDRIRLGTEASALERGARGLRVRTRSGTIDAGSVVIATPAWAAARLLGPLDRELAHELDAIEHVDADVITLAYPRAAIAHRLDGTGHVVATPGRATRACTWVSEKWEGRAPSGTALLRVVVDAPGATDEDAVALARAELEPVLGIEGEPELVRVRRRRAALPIPGVGHLARRRRIGERASAMDGPAGKVRLAGAALGALGVPDCASSALRAASEILA